MRPMASQPDRALPDRQYRDARNLAACFRLHRRFSTNRYPFHRWPEWNITLSDFSFGMLCEARRNLKSVGDFDFQQIDAGAIPYRDRTFDAVIANQRLYHVRDLGHTLRAIRRELKAGATLYTTTVGATHMRRLKEIARRFVDPPPMVAAEQFGLESGLVPLRQP